MTVEALRTSRIDKQINVEMTVQTAFLQHQKNFRKYKILLFKQPKSEF